MKTPHNFVDRTGSVQGLLTVLRRAQSKGNNAGWLCRCACGEEKVISAPALRHGQKSCGCDRGRRGQRKPGYVYKLPAGAAARNRVLKQYRVSARARGLEWRLPNAYFFILIRMACHYCGAPPSQISKTPRGQHVHAGVDRKDNSQGYVPGNVVPCCSVCNHAKKDMTYGAFLAWIERLVSHRRRQ